MKAGLPRKKKHRLKSLARRVQLKKQEARNNFHKMTDKEIFARGYKIGSWIRQELINLKLPHRYTDVMTGNV